MKEGARIGEQYARRLTYVIVAVWLVLQLPCKMRGQTGRMKLLDMRQGRMMILQLERDEVTSILIPTIFDLPICLAMMERLTITMSSIMVLLRVLKLQVWFAVLLLLLIVVANSLRTVSNGLRGTQAQHLRRFSLKMV